MRLNLLILSIGILSITQSIYSYRPELNKPKHLESRAIHHFGINCQLNEYLEAEYELGFKYLNASIYMKQDRVALNGFGKMFKKFWHKQIENIEKLTDYIVLRGGKLDLEKLSFKSEDTLNKVNYFENESLTIETFLTFEKDLNKKLIDAHKSTSDNQTELTCRDKRQYMLYSLPTESDPASASFLDENFLKHKVERIKFFADLERRINRFDQHPRHIAGVTHHLNPLGIHLLDKELEETFN